MSDLYENAVVAKLPKSEVEITATIPAAVLEKQYPKALKKLNESANLPGFRAGHIPEKVLIERLGDMAILEEAADMILPEIVYQLFTKHAPNAIGRPNVSITKIAKGSPLEFKVKTAVLPEVTLPDYKKIAAEKNKDKIPEVTVDDSEVQNVLIEMQKAIADREKKEPQDVPLDDSFAKKIGNFPDFADLKVKVKENLMQEKMTREAEKRRGALIDALLEKTSTELPDMLVRSELERMMARFEDDIARMGLKPEDYFKHIKKTPEDIRKEWVPQAEKNAKLDLLLATIAKEEKLVPDAEMVENETKHILSHHKDANEESVRSYVTMVLTHQKVFEFLELQK